MRKSHFTLIELLIVIAVIVILMGIAIAVSGPMMAKAENNACAALIQKVLGACEKFKTDFGAYPGEFSALKTRDIARQAPRLTTDEASYGNNNELARYLFKRIPGQGSDQGATNKGTVTSWHGDYLDSADVGEQYVNNLTILDYWQEKPLVYWLRYKDGNGVNASELKKKLTPELWSIGGDGSANQNCLKLYAYPDLKKCRNGNSSDHAKDEDNVGGDLNTMKK